ncbi:hypothetical protein [Variovorax sp. KBS0712]|uniref:hypothetical protein n=1 Tax=Variovorax sp. KBS0712 TaxID=2578111 RepID=UPI00163DA4F9|nr:hypothetical protein [Variovorax sp. KBS0712]
MRRLDRWPSFLLVDSTPLEAQEHAYRQQGQDASQNQLANGRSHGCPRNKTDRDGTFNEVKNCIYLCAWIEFGHTFQRDLAGAWRCPTVVGFVMVAKQSLEA